jgi:hypothetical protein
MGVAMTRATILQALVVGLSLCACSSGHNGAAPGINTSTTTASSNSGCRFASLAEISSATKLSLSQTEDRGRVGCLYQGGNGYVKLTLFATSDWDTRLNKQASGANSTIEDVPGLGIEAKRVSPDLFVKVDSENSFEVLVSPSQSQNDEVAVAEVLVPRVSAA